LLVSLLAVSGQSLTTQVAHVRLAPDEKFLMCARAVLGQPVFRGYASPWPGEIVCCPIGVVRDADRGSDAASVTLLLVRAAELAPNRQSVVAMLGGAGPGRLVHGEIRDGHYHSG
jgi:hypothetical protein